MAGEKRLIDANELVRKINELDVFYFSGETDIQIHDCQMVELGAVLAAIDEAATVDALEVVRCKDCKKREICRTTNIWAVAPNDDWYCADGGAKYGL